MCEDTKEIVSHSGKKEPLAGFRVEIEDTKENRQRVKEVVDGLTEAVSGGANIGFGVGLRDGKLVMGAEDLDHVLQSKRKRRS